MKILLSIFFLLTFSLTMSSQSQVYISNNTNGHKVEFLIVSRDSVIFETYIMRYKLTVPLSRKIYKHLIIQNSNEVIKTDKFDIIMKSNDVLRINKTLYFRDLIIEKPGDFFYIDNSFGSTCNHNRLKRCRSYYAKQKR